jgi:hypothetical protein
MVGKAIEGSRSDQRNTEGTEISILIIDRVQFPRRTIDQTARNVLPKIELPSMTYWKSEEPVVFPKRLRPKILGSCAPRACLRVVKYIKKRKTYTIAGNSI